jgi:anti-anti-sigma factor
METTETRSGDTLVVAPRGRLDADSATPFQEALLAHVEAGDRSILLDLADLTYVSSAGLRVLLTTARSLQAQGGRLEVCAVRGEVQDVLEMTGLDAFVKIHADREAALASR